MHLTLLKAFRTRTAIFILKSLLLTSYILYRVSSFGGIICLRPPVASLDTPYFNLDSVSSLLNEGGFFVLGMTEAEVNHHGLATSLKGIETAHGIDLVGVQVIKCRPQDVSAPAGATSEIGPEYLNYYLISMLKKSVL
jgi:hypothetical protein